jgi:hypothetical protein
VERFGHVSGMIKRPEPACGPLIAAFTVYRADAQTRRYARPVPPCRGEPDAFVRLDRARDLLLRRSFRATPPPATVQVRPRVVGLSVPLNDRRGRHVLARIWHGHAGSTKRLSMRTIGSVVDSGHMRRLHGLLGRSRLSDVGPVAAQLCCTRLI